jgi:AraC family transcriptional regulator
VLFHGISPEIECWMKPKGPFPGRLGWIKPAAQITFVGENRLTFVGPTAPNPLRRIGWVYGQVQDRLDLDGASLFETTHRRRTEVPLHEHEFPYLTLLINGKYREPFERGDSQFIPFSAVFHPLHTRHAGVVEDKGCRFFTLELEPSWLEKMNAKVPEDSVFDWHGQRFLWLMLRLFREYRDEQARFSLTMESLTLEVLGALALGKDDQRNEPASAWRRLRERMHDSFRESLRIGDLAAAAGVHPVYVARLFRRRTGQTPGEYLQRLRAQHACRLMQQPERSLCDVAMDSGFCDQSHMNRVLRRFAQCSPGTIRTLTQ